MSRLGVLRTLALGAILTALTAGTAAAQRQTGAIAGRITDANTGQPIPAAQVIVVGTNLGAQTSSEGVYTLRGIAPGTVMLRVLTIGYAEQSRQVNVIAGETATADFSMQPVAIALAPVVITATGEQRRNEVGNSIGRVNASEAVQSKPIANVADLLTARTPGVMVFPGTQTGAGVRVRIRGMSSLSLSNNPIYVIDGVRVEGTTGSMSVDVGGTQPSRISDINPEEIESIEIVRGPSASTLYGTDAANGVIVITTKRGVAGRPQWTYYTEQTAITDRNDYPDAYWGWTAGSTPSNSTQCFLYQLAAGTCSQDSVTVYNLHEDPDATPYGIGYRQQHGLQVRGGTETIRYFLHGEWEDEDGVTKVPEFEKRYLASRGLSLRPEEESPNRLTRATARANLNITPSSNADLNVSVGYITQDLRLPTSDDSGLAGVATNTYGGPGFKYNLDANGDTLYGWRAYTPRTIYQRLTQQSIERVIGSIGTNWRPREWLALRGNFGLDYINRQDIQLCRFGECPEVSDYNLGYKTDNRTNFFTYTLDASATVTRELLSNVVDRG